MKLTPGLRVPSKPPGERGAGRLREKTEPLLRVVLATTVRRFGAARRFGATWGLRSVPVMLESRLALSVMTVPVMFSVVCPVMVGNVDMDAHMGGVVRTVRGV